MKIDNVERKKNIAYITDLAYELHKMAKQNKSPLLALLLEMVVHEGKSAIKKFEYQENN